MLKQNQKSDLTVRTKTRGSRWCFWFVRGVGLAAGLTAAAAHAQTDTNAAKPDAAQSKALVTIPAGGGLSAVPQNLITAAKPNSSTVVQWLGITPKTAGGFGVYPMPGEVGAPGSLGIGVRIYEDYSYLQSPALRTDYTDPIKYIPIGGNPDVFLTFNGDERLKVDNLSIGNYGVGKGPYSYNSFTHEYSGVPCEKCNGTGVYWRFDLGSNLQITKYFRFYAELLDAQVNQGAPSHASPTIRNDMVLVQGVGEADAYAFGGKEGLQIGREFALFHWVGLGTSSQPSVLVPSYDGVHAFYDNGAMRNEFFYWNLLSLKLGGFEDYTNYTQAVWGTYNTFVLPKWNVLAENVKSNLDLFYFNTRSGKPQGPNIADSEFAVYGPPNAHGIQSVKFLTGSDHRNTFGVEYYGTLGNWIFDDSIAGQTGTFINNPVSGYYVGTKTGYIFHDKPWSPNPFLRVDVASSNWEQIGQSTFLIDQNSFLIETNLINIAPHIVVMPTKTFSVDAFASALIRYNDHDAITNGQFSGPSSTLNLTAFVPGSYVGTLLDFRTNWAIVPHLSLSTEVAELIAGPVLRNAHAPNSLYLESQLEYKF